jgi:branched-chain amino acid transport system permease protein
VYALVALAFVVVYKASRMINFALGEWVLLGSRMVAAGMHGLGLGLIAALALGCAGMVGVAVAFSRVVLQRVRNQPVIALIMVTIGLGILLRGGIPLAFSGVPGTIPLPPLDDLVAIYGVPIATEKLAAAAVAVVAIVALTWFFHASRTGVALRALASDPQVAAAMGIDARRHFAITWALAGALSVLAGVLWAAVSGGGFGIEVLGLKVFPIVIIGGLDSIAGTILAAVAVGVIESLAAGYIDPGFSHVASYLVLVAALFVRPYGVFGRPDVARV